MRKNPHHRIYTTLIIGLLFFLLYSCSKTEDNSILITDGEGNDYKTITIGTQIWMKENLSGEFGAY
jgi:hypothetical protein